MINFRDYFSDKEIIYFFAKKRARAAKDVHDHQFLRNISSLATKPFNPNKKKRIYRYTPKRNNWVRLKKKERANYSDSVQINTVQIERTIHRDHRRVVKGQIPEPEWHKNLFGFIQDLQASLFENHYYEMRSPEPIPQLKDEKKRTFRPICFYNLKDRLVISQTSQYLTKVFDDIFYENSYAFRYSGRINKKNHHRSVDDLITFRNNNLGRLYVSECDIKKFYDSINHNVIIACYGLLKNELKKNGIIIDEIAEKIFYQYLQKYSFNHSIYYKQNEILSARGIKNGSIPWVDKTDLEIMCSDPVKDRIGIPQGGALSCLIANIVLHFADKEVLSDNYRKLFYARFCDDMVILHTSKKQCQKAYHSYLRALNKLKLVEHKPKEYESYSKDFWSIKTKEPYIWNKNNHRHYLAKKNVPWVAFVGYQIRYDGLVRVRASSIKKELKKQVIETDKVLKSIREKHAVRLNKKAIKFRFMQRMIAMSVGRVNAKNPTMCWSSGFQILKNQPCLKSQLRKLDRNRAKQIKRLEKNIKQFEDVNKRKSNKLRVLPYHGAYISYYHQFVKERK